MFLIDKNILDNLLEEAKNAPLLKVSKVLDTEREVVLNALRPWSPVPTHKANKSVCITTLRGCADVVLYNDLGAIAGCISLNPAHQDIGVCIPGEQWYAIEVLSPCVLMITGDSPLDAISPENIMY